MNCNKYADERVLFAYGESNDTKFESHLKSCETCQGEVAACRAAFAGTRAMQQAPEPSLNNDRLRQAILSQELKPRVSPWFMRLGTAGASAAAVVAVWLAVGKGLGENAVAPSVVGNPEGPVAIQDSKPSNNPIAEFSPVPPPDVLEKPSSTSTHSVRASRRVARKSNLPDMVAVARGGVSEAVDVYSEAPRTEAAPGALTTGRAEPEAGVIIIRPDGSGANERSSSDVAIGG